MAQHWRAIPPIALLFAAAFCAAPFAHAQSRAPADGAPIVLGMSHTFASSTLGDSREVNVWLPPGYGQSHERYSVLYVLDGALSQDFPHIAGLGQLGALSATYESLIVVGVETRQRRRELTAAPHDPRFVRAFPEGGGAPLFRRFLTQEVIPFVEAHYRTGRRRALMGESLAGLFVVETFLRAPDSFDDYIAMSPSLWWDDRSLARSAAALLARHRPSQRRFYLSVANEGGTMQTGVDELRAALEARPPPGLSWTYVDRSASETHATIYHVAALDALRTFYRLPPYDTGPTPWFMIEGAAPP